METLWTDSRWKKTPKHFSKPITRSGGQDISLDSVSKEVLHFLFSEINLTLLMFLLNKLWKKASFSCVHHCALSLRHCFNNSHETPLFFHMTLMHRGGERSSSLFIIVLTTYNWGCIFGLAQQSHHSWIPSKRLIRGWTTRNTTHCPRMTRVQRHVPNNAIYTFAGVEEHCEIGLFAVALRNSLCSVASKWISMLMIGYS